MDCEIVAVIADYVGFWGYIVEKNEGNSYNIYKRKDHVIRMMINNERVSLWWQVDNRCAASDYVDLCDDDILHKIYSIVNAANCEVEKYTIEHTKREFYKIFMILYKIASIFFTVSVIYCISVYCIFKLIKYIIN